MSGKTCDAVDYNYDANGSLTRDLNKDIGSQTADGIIYNHLNLPWQISFRSATGTKGTITYIYDAAGNKLKKTTLDSVGNLQTVTTYIGPFQYQGKQALGAGVPADTLQFFGQEEGRVRLKTDTANGQTVNSWKYDYFLKDHLGNTRMVLTDEQEADQYPAATMEIGDSSLENLYYTNLDETRVALPPGYPTDTTTNPNQQVSQLYSTGTDPVYGPGIVLKVMAGDMFSVRTSYWYQSGGPTPNQVPNPATDIISALLAAAAHAPGEVTTTGSGIGGANLSPNLSKFLADTGTVDETKPHAFLNWVLLDNQFNYVQSGSGYRQVTTPDALTNITLTNLPVPASGFLYIYLSNTTPNVPVFFDNLQVTHTRGPLLEEDHYYPFGLTMAGISDKALKSNYAENKYRFNKGSELQNKEFSDGSGLEMYETYLRELDPQLGRWWQIDPVFSNGVDGDDEVNDVIIDGLKSQSPYASMDNNPVLRSDPNGDCPLCVVAILIGLLTTSEPAVAPSSNHAHDLQDNQAINKAHTDATLHAAGSLLTGGAKMIVAVGKAIYDSRQVASTQQEASTSQKPRNAPAQEGAPNSSKIESKDASGKTTKYSTYDKDGKLVKQVEADRGVSRHGVNGATKKTPTENRLPDGTTKPGKLKIEPASPEETPPGNNKKT